MNDQTQKLKAIRRLLGQFAERRGPVGETLEQRAERMALVTSGYLTAIDGFDIDLVEAGVTLVLQGGLPGHDMSFAPTAPQLATACRMAAERAARQRYLEGITAQRLPAPEITHTPEERARAKALVNAYVKAHEEQQASIEMDAKAKDKLARHDSFFADEFVPTDGGVGRISRTLAKKLGYSSGSPESDEAAA